MTETDRDARSTDGDANPDICVIGAGIIGVTTALSLQESGSSVTLVDSSPPGRETSFGNTGVIVDNPWMVINNPDLPRKLARILLRQTPSVRLCLSHILSRAGFFSQFIGYCAQDHAGRTGLAIADMLAHSHKVHQRWMTASGAGHIVRKTGWLKVFRSMASVSGFEKERALIDEAGVGYRIIQGADLAAVEPGICRTDRPLPFVQGLLLEGAASLSDPLTLTELYVALFKARGGEIRRSRVRSVVRMAGGKGWQVQSGDAGGGTGGGGGGGGGGGTMSARHVVIATGPWAPDLTAPLGYRIPMFWERGYHQHVTPGHGAGLSRAVHDVDGGYVMTPQTRGVRVTSGVEITHRDARPDYSQIRNAVAAAREVADLGAPIEETPWHGSRPSLIDGLPMIGAAPGNPGLWFNFGHHHIGLSLAAASGDLLAALIGGAAPPINPAPFDPLRFQAMRAAVPRVAVPRAAVPRAAVPGVN